MANIPLIPWRPYWGVSSNANTLSATLTAKAKIVEEQTGITLALVQGAPSGSSKSAGTHLGWGNAADWSIVGKPRGMSTQDACILLSRWFRTLTCLSYVRGLDVDNNGVPDDTFDWHLHVIDYEDMSALTRGQRSQYDDYMAGRDALVGGRRDREQRPDKTFTLIQWYSNLTPGESAPSPEEDDMAVIESISDDAADKIGRAIAKHMRTQTQSVAVQSFSDAAATKAAVANATVSFAGKKVGEAIIETAANTRPPAGG